MRCPLRIRSIPGWSRCFDSLELELRAVSEVGKKQIVEGEEGGVSIGSSFFSHTICFDQIASTRSNRATRGLTKSTYSR